MREACKIEGEPCTNVISDLFLQFDQTLGEWEEIGKMLEARFSHAASTVNWLEVEKYCVD